MKSNSDKTTGSFRVVTGWASRLTRLTTALVGLCFCALLGNPGLGFSAVLPPPYSLTLAWTPSAIPGAVGSRLYYGTASGNYTDVIEVGNVTTVTVPGLVSGVTYYFAITVVDANELESPYSAEASYPQVPSGTQLQISAVAGGQFLLAVTGPVGHTNTIEASPDLKTWNVIGTVIIGAGGSASFTDVNAAGFSQRFYRTRDAQP